MSRAAARQSRVSTHTHTFSTAAQKPTHVTTPPPSSLTLKEPSLLASQQQDHEDEDERALDEENSVQEEEELLRHLDEVQVCQCHSPTVLYVARSWAPSYRTHVLYCTAVARLRAYTRRWSSSLQTSASCLQVPSLLSQRTSSTKP